MTTTTEYPVRHRGGELRARISAEQGAPGDQPGARQVGRRGAGHPALGAAGRQRAGRQGDRLGRRQRAEQRRPGPGDPGGRHRLRRRGPDRQAHPAARAGSRVPNPQAHQPHHRDRREPSRAQGAVVASAVRLARGGRRAARLPRRRRPRRLRPRRLRPRRLRPPRRRPNRRRRARSSGPENQPPRLPARYHHRLEVPVVRRQAVRGLRQGRRRDPSAAGHRPRARRHRRRGDRAHP